MPSFSVGTALWIFSFALVTVPIGLQLMNLGHFREARVCVAVAVLLGETVFLGWLNGSNWTSGTTIPLFVAATAVLGIALLTLLRVIKQGEPALSLEVVGVLAFDQDSGVGMAIGMRITNNGASTVARDYSVTLVDTESGERFSGKAMQLDQPYWIKALPDEFGGRKPLREDAWLRGATGKEPITRELNGFLLVVFSENLFRRHPVSDSVNLETCLVEVECRDSWGHAWGPAVFQASKEHPIGYGVLSLTAY